MSMGASLAHEDTVPRDFQDLWTMVKEYCGHLGRYGLMILRRQGDPQTRCDIQAG